VAVRLRARQWWALSALLGAGALAGALLPSHVLDWQPALAQAQPWRAWSAAFVHWSVRHLAANMAALLLVGALGAAAGCPGRATLAWALAWPIGHALLLVQPRLLHYGGLSGVLHAGVAVAAWQLVAAARGARRAIGIAVLAGLAVKLLLEAPWAGPVRTMAGWDIPIAPLAHATGALAGLCCAIALRR
jgi:rhomboid family GlyGly-CTERM serine protease